MQSRSTAARPFLSNRRTHQSYGFKRVCGMGIRHAVLLVKSEYNCTGINKNSGKDKYPPSLDTYYKLQNRYKNTGRLHPETGRSIVRNRDRYFQQAVLRIFLEAAVTGEYMFQQKNPQLPSISRDLCPVIPHVPLRKQQVFAFHRKQRNTPHPA